MLHRSQAGGDSAMVLPLWATTVRVVVSTAGERLLP